MLLNSSPSSHETARRPTKRAASATSRWFVELPLTLFEVFKDSPGNRHSLLLGEIVAAGFVAMIGLGVLGGPQPL
jgi:hypothetical protein